MKTCTKCGETKSASEFGKASNRRDGLRCWCKPCSSIAGAAYRSANKEKVKAINAKWVAANPDKVAAISAKWKAANPEKAKAISAKWYAANPEKAKECCAKWAAANREKRRAYNAQWRMDNNGYGTAYRAANPEAGRIHKQNRRARIRKNGGVLSKDLPERLFKLQRGKCACCGVKIDDVNHLDHVIPVALGGANEDWNMQLLCPPCNLSKGAKHPVDFMQQQGYLI